MYSSLYQIPINTNQYFVTKGGSDITGNGAVGSSYQTISNALSQITNNNPTGICKVILGPGIYNDTISLLPNVIISGTNRNSTILTGSISLDPSWNVAGNNKGGFVDLLINPNTTLSLNAVSCPVGGLSFDRVLFNNNLTVVADTSANTCQYVNCQFNGNYTQYGMVCMLNSCIFQSSNSIYISSMTGISTTTEFLGGSCLGTSLTVSSTGTDTATAYLVNFLPSGGLIENGSNTTIKYTSSSLPLSTTINGGTFTSLNPPQTAPLLFNSGGSLILNDFLSLGSIKSTESQAQILMTRAATINNLYVTLSVAPGSGANRIFTVRQNGVNTALTVTITGVALTASNTTNSISVNPSDLISIQNTSTSGTPGTSNAVVSLAYY